MSQDIRMCFIGDSYVAGVGDETMLGWAGRLCAGIDQTCVNVTYYNLGIKRNTSREILLRWQGECAARFPVGCDARVVFSCGVGDTLLQDGIPKVSIAESRANIRQTLSSAKQRYRVILVGPPPVREPEHNARVAELSKAFQTEADILGVPYVELYTVLLDDSNYQREIAEFDQIHPHSKGYTKIAKIIGDSRQWWFHRTR